MRELLLLTVFSALVVHVLGASQVGAASAVQQQQGEAGGAAAPPRYAHRPYGVIVAEMQRLAKRHPQFVELYNAQDKYGLQSPGTCTDDAGASTPCKTWILRITNEATLEADGRDRPEVFFSGCLHGDEWVGPSSMVELALYLVKTRVAGSNPWISRLVDTRSILIMPMTNAIGYQQTSREENGMDPNRDFPYMRTPATCMTTITARAVNEVWREHLVQMAVTFHGGMQVLSRSFSFFYFPTTNSLLVFPLTSLLVTAACRRSPTSGGHPTTRRRTTSRRTTTRSSRSRTP
jgi:hypothetical protein